MCAPLMHVWHHHGGNFCVNTVVARTLTSRSLSSTRAGRHACEAARHTILDHSGDYAGAGAGSRRGALGHHHRYTGRDQRFSQFVALSSALIFSSWVSQRAPAGRARWAWRCIALALLSYVIAEAIVIYFSTVQKAAPAASVADAFFLPFYPLMALGVLLLPATRGSGNAQARVLLDVGIAIGALLSVGLVFLIAPRYSSGTPVDFVFIGYPIADFTLLLVLVVMIMRGLQSDYRPVFFWLAIGMFCFIYADSAFNYLTLPNLAIGQTYAAGLPYVDPFWIAGAFAFALAPLYLLSQGSEASAAWEWLEKLTERATATPFYRSLGQVILLYAPVLVLFGLLFFVKPQERGYNTYLALVVMALFVVMLIITRQWLTTRDLVDARIATERAQQLDSLKNQFITNVNHELRTPMMTMQGYIEILGDLQQQIDAAKQADMLGRARRATSRWFNCCKACWIRAASIKRPVISSRRLSMSPWWRRWRSHWWTRVRVSWPNTGW